MTTANKITIFRVILIPVFLVLMYLRFPGHTYWAFGVFVLASLRLRRRLHRAALQSGVGFRQVHGSAGR